MHYYNYENDCWNVDGYPKPRFASEYGFQSYPSFETLAEVSLPKDWTINSAFMKNRQHHLDGKYENHHSLNGFLYLRDKLRFARTMFHLKLVWLDL